MDTVTGKALTELVGVEWRPLRVIADDRGAVLHMMRADTPGFSSVREIYFSELRPRIIKGWKRHIRMTQRFVVPVGRIRFVLYDARDGMATSGQIMVCCSGRPDRYGLLTIPPGIWYGFENIGEAPALIANCADQMHDPTESKTLPLNSGEIPYQWSVAGP